MDQAPGRRDDSAAFDQTHRRDAKRLEHLATPGGTLTDLQGNELAYQSGFRHGRTNRGIIGTIVRCQLLVRPLLEPCGRYALTCQRDALRLRRAQQTVDRARFKGDVFLGRGDEGHKPCRSMLAPPQHRHPGRADVEKDDVSSERGRWGKGSACDRINGERASQSKISEHAIGYVPPRAHIHLRKG